jgi:hypothetical protein
MTPRVSDNDRDEITATLDGKEIRGWTYSSEQERRTKMLCAREFVEGLCVRADISERMADALKQCADARMPGEARRIAREALRSAATPALGYAEGFGACRLAAINELQTSYPDHAWLNAACAAIRSIAAIPAPAGEEVPYDVLARWLLDNLSLDADHQEDAHKLLSRFTILAKPAQEGQGL